MRAKMCAKTRDHLETSGPSRCLLYFSLIFAMTLLQLSSATDHFADDKSFANYNKDRQSIDGLSENLSKFERIDANYLNNVSTSPSIDSPAMKIEQLRYNLQRKSSERTITVIADIAQTFYDNVKYLWELIANETTINGNALRLYAYNDTSCKLVAKLRNGDEREPAEIRDVPTTRLLPEGRTTTEEKGPCLACVKIALESTEPGSSIFLLTGRTASDEIALGKSITLEMIRNGCEFYSVWCPDTAGRRDDAVRFERISRRTNGEFVQFTTLDRRAIDAEEDSMVAQATVNVQQTGSGHGEHAFRMGDSDDVVPALSTSALLSDNEKLLESASSGPMRLDPNTSSKNCVQTGEKDQSPGSTLVRSRTSRDQDDSEGLEDVREISTSRWDGGRPSERTENEPVDIAARMIVHGRMGEALEAEDMQRASYTVVEAATRVANASIELASDSSLVSRAGALTRLIFRVTNGHSLTVRHYFTASGTSVNIVNLQPRNVWIDAGETANVIMDVLVPSTTSDSSTAQVTLIVQGIGIVQKSAYIYVSSSITDTAQPTINYDFNNNCAAKLSSDSCANSLWSVNINIQDSTSGLKRVESSPRGIMALDNFIAGTKSSTKFQYVATCCNTKVVVTAEDVLGNSKSETLDVTVWYNLSQGEVIAIVLGVLFLLFIIILLVLILIFCIRKRRKSMDLSYSQRYGSRTTPARAQRTSF